jgi:hypothetical protein
VRPDVFAAVMATGIVSIAAADHGFRVVSDNLVVLAAVAIPVLIVVMARAWPPRLAPCRARRCCWRSTTTAARLS